MRKEGFCIFLVLRTKKITEPASLSYWLMSYYW